VTGVVGQRATRKDAPDGYRLCLRDASDVVAVAAAVPAPGVTASGPSGSPATAGSGGASANGLVIPISAALRRLDEDVAIEGIVTVPATLLDATGRRIVVQDASAAIELLLPGGADAPPVGTRIQANGRAGVAYGAPRLRADDVTVIGNGRQPAPLTLRGQPGQAEEWRLASITGRIDDVRKLGDRWRAELLVSGTTVVVVGQPGAGIAVTTMVEGRMATVVGIVRRPNPTSSDQRFAITPRTLADVRIHGAAATAAGRGSGSPEGGSSGSTASTATIGEPGTASASGLVDADLIDLAAFVGQRVRVGGLVVDLRADGVLLDDGTAVGFVVVTGPALELLPLLEPDDAINAIGLVGRVPDGVAVIVDEPGGLIQAGDPVAAPNTVRATNPVEREPTTNDTAGSAAGSATHAGFLDGSSGMSTGLAGLAGLGTLIALTVASLLVTLGRRVHARRRTMARVAARVAAFEASAGPRSTP
jgi:hypothetical protein